MTPAEQHLPATLYPCNHEVQATLQVTMEVLSGRWKIPVLGALRLSGKRFMELQREVAGIGPKMLAHILQELEQQGLVVRTVQATRPVTVDYALTDYGCSLDGIIDAMIAWGRIHQILQAAPGVAARQPGS